MCIIKLSCSRLNRMERTSSMILGRRDAVFVGVVEAFHLFPDVHPPFPSLILAFETPLKETQAVLAPPSRPEQPEGWDASEPWACYSANELEARPSSDSPGPSLPVELISDLFVLQQVLLDCFKHQAEVIAGLFREVTQGAPNQWFLRDPLVSSGNILADLCTMHQWQLVSVPVLILF